MKMKIKFLIITTVLFVTLMPSSTSAASTDHSIYVCYDQAYEADETGWPFNSGSYKLSVKIYEWNNPFAILSVKLNNPGDCLLKTFSNTIVLVKIGLSNPTAALLTAYKSQGLFRADQISYPAQGSSWTGYGGVEHQKAKFGFPLPTYYETATYYIDWERGSDGVPPGAGGGGGCNIPNDCFNP